MTDVLLYHTHDNGEIEIEGGTVTMTDDARSAVYLSLFGGNLDDDGSQDNRRSWWGNALETDTAGEYRSETQYLLGTIPATPRNLRRLEDAAKRDLAWLDDGSVEAALVGLNRVEIRVIIEDTEFIYVENWGPVN